MYADNIFFALLHDQKEVLQPLDSPRFIIQSHKKNAEVALPAQPTVQEKSQAERALFIIARSALACNLPS
jgi:hypothetical protein